MDLQLAFDKMIRDEKQKQRVEILREMNHLVYTEPTIAKEEFVFLEEQNGIDYYPAFSKYFDLLGNFGLAWIYPNSADPGLSGEFHLNNVIDIFFLEHMLSNDSMPGNLKELIQALKPFDEHPQFGDGILSAFRIMENHQEPEIWLYDGSRGGECFKMEIDIHDYFLTLLDFRGAIPWQYLYCKINLNDIEFKLQREYLSQLLDMVPKIFPETDFQKYISRYQSMLSKS